jgi:hypothetical protein
MRPSNRLAKWAKAADLPEAEGIRRCQRSRSTQRQEQDELLADFGGFEVMTSGVDLRFGKGSTRLMSLPNGASPTSRKAPSDPHLRLR